MITQNRAWSCTEQVLPLSKKAQQAAAECHRYALEHGLVLDLLTQEHLKYQNSVAKEEEAQITSYDRLLDDSHLPPLEIPSAVISEVWTVHQRVASVLEAACRWLPDAQLRACEAVVVEAQQKNTLARLPACKTKTEVQSLKLDPPILCSDHREDCAELRRLVASYEDQAGTRLRNLQESTDIESELFSIPEEYQYYARGLEDELILGTIAVQEQTILWLMAHLGGMEWKAELGDDDDRRYRTMASRRLSSPLPPALSVDEYVPEGDVCLVSDVSDLSSSMSEYAEKAEDAIPRKASDDYTEVDEPVMMSVFEPANSLVSEFDHIAPITIGLAEEDDISMFPSYYLEDTEARPPLSWYPVRDDGAFSDQIDEPTFRVCIDEAYNENRPARDTEDALEVSATPCNNSPQSSAQEEGFEAVTIDTLLSLEEDKTLELAKIPVPHLSTKRYLPEWADATSSPPTLFQWMLHNDNRAYTFEEWHAPQPSRLDDEFDAFVAGGIPVLDETWFADEKANAERTLWIRQNERTPDNSVCLLLKVSEGRPEEQLTPWTSLPTRARSSVQQTQSGHQDVPSQSQAPSDPETSPGSEPHMDQVDSSTWGSLMTRFKKRRHVEFCQSWQSITAERPLCIKAPELLIGSRTFADARPASIRSAGGMEHITPKSMAEPSSLGTNEDANMPDADMDLVVNADLPKVIMSTSIPRAIRSQILKLLPGLPFIERDYRPTPSASSDTEADDEADIVVSPTSGVNLTTMVSLRQMNDQARPIFQSRLAQIASKYETLHVLVYRHNARAIQSNGDGAADTLELAPSDAMAYARLSGFAKSLACDVHVSYISGGEMDAAQCAATLLNRSSTDKERTSEKYLVEEGTDQELFLRHAGLNVYDAQVVLGILGEQYGKIAGFKLVQAFLGKAPEERVRLFQEVVGSGRTLNEVNGCLQ